MESRNQYRRGSSHQSPFMSDPFWLILGAIYAIALTLAALPALIIGFFAQRSIERYLSRFGRRWSTALWVVLLAPSALLFATLYQHGLQHMLQRELLDYYQSGKAYQADLARWNFWRLWSETWSVWLRTLVGIPIVGLWQEISTGMRGGQTPRMLAQNEHGRQRRITRAQQRARKRTLRPERLPDEIVGMIMIGVPIDDKEQE